MKKSARIVEFQEFQSMVEIYQISKSSILIFIEKFEMKNSDWKKPVTVKSLVNPSPDSLIQKHSRSSFC